MKKVGRKAFFDDQFNSLINVGDHIYLSGEYTSNQVKCCVHNYVHNKDRNPNQKVLTYKKMPTGDHRVMLMESKSAIYKIKKNAPKDATHYYMEMFLGVVYIKYFENYPYYFHDTVNTWTKCNSYFEAKPLY